MPKLSILRPSLAYLLILSLFCVVAASSAEKPKAKEPAPRFNATTTGGEKFNNDSIKAKSYCWNSGPPGAATVFRNLLLWTN
jgi:hypothetical protein